MVDIAFILDFARNNKNPSLFDQQKTIAKKILDQFIIGPQYTLAGFVYNDYQPSVASYLNSFSNKKDLFSFIDRLRKYDDGYNLEASIEKVMNQVFSSSRKDSMKTVVIFRTHKSPNSINENLDVFKLNDIKVHIIGLGNEVNEEELVELAGGDKNDVIILPDGDNNNIDNLIDNLLPGESYIT